jgi:hypothetical protein
MHTFDVPRRALHCAPQRRSKRLERGAPAFLRHFEYFQRNAIELQRESSKRSITVAANARDDLGAALAHGSVASQRPIEQRRARARGKCRQRASEPNG